MDQLETALLLLKRSQDIIKQDNELIDRLWDIINKQST